MKRILLAITALLVVGSYTPHAYAITETAQFSTSSEVAIYLFGRDDCKYCQAEKRFLETQAVPHEYLDIVNSADAAALFEALAEKHNVPKVTPLTIVGEHAVVGYDGDQTTGAALLRLAERAYSEKTIMTPHEHFERAPAGNVTIGAGCSEAECDTGSAMEYVFDLPLLGLTDLKSLSLFTLSVLLGTIDGFNPCAMWVLITFLVLLSQAGSRQKMIVLAGVFIVAEAIMYNLILNVWYKAWDFVALDQIVTPLVGVLALFGGGFFLYRWRKNKDTALVCDISDFETQNKTISRFTAIARQPITLASIAAILIIAFSVNIIEFACSIGIPQAYTKILELNGLSFFERQMYILVYTFGYMVDDFLVFGLAIWGYSKLEAHGHRYAQLSLLIGGVLMLLLGAVLVLSPEWLVL